MDFFNLLAQLDIGKASFLALIALVFWQGRQMVAALQRIEAHMRESAVYMRQAAHLNREVVAVLRRKGIEIRDREEVPK